MASMDKTLGRLSAATTLVLMAGLIGALFLPVRHGGPARAPAGPGVHVSKPGAAKSPAQPDKMVPEPAAPAGEAASSAPVEETTWSDAELNAGLRACVELLAPVSAEIALDEPMRKGQCGTPAPLRLRSVGSASKVTFDPPPQMNCKLAAAVARWVEDVLQPTAREMLGARVTRILGASSYSCRNIYHRAVAPLSEHATGNAVDISAFVTADGRTIRVSQGWGPTERDIAAAKRKAAVAAAGKVSGGKNSHPEEAEKAGDAKSGSDKSAEKAGNASVVKAGLTTEKTSPAVATTGALTAAKTTEAAFLRRLHSGACTVFGTVLGPEANEAHRDHFHLDMRIARAARSATEGRRARSPANPVSRETWVKHGFAKPPKPGAPCRHCRRPNIPVRSLTPARPRCH
jgi:hypothetical protein